MDDYWEQLKIEFPWLEDEVIQNVDVTGADGNGSYLMLELVNYLIAYHHTQGIQHAHFLLGKELKKQEEQAIEAQKNLSTNKGWAGRWIPRRYRTDAGA